MSKLAFFLARALKILLQYLDFERLAPELALQFADAGFHLAYLAMAGHVIVAGSHDAPAFLHQRPPALQQVRRDPVAARHHRYAFATIECLFDDPQFLSRTPVTAPTAVGDDLGHGHKPIFGG